MIVLIYLTLNDDTSLSYLMANLLIVFSKGKIRTPSSKCWKIIALVLVLNSDDSQSIIGCQNKSSPIRHETFPNTGNFSESANRDGLNFTLQKIKTILIICQSTVFRGFVEILADCMDLVG